MERSHIADSTNAYIGARIRHARLMRGMNQKELGQSLKKPITFQQVQKYESATNRISVETLEEFAALLQLPITFFLPSQDTEFKPLLTPSEAELLECFHAMDTKSQAALIALLKGTMRVI